MKSLPEVRTRTRLFARILGPYLVVAALTLAAHASDLRALLAGYAGGAWPWVTGAFVLPMGLVIVVLHPFWRGGAAATVSTIGWLTLVKGVVLMAAPRVYLSWGSDAVGALPWWQASAVALGLVGLYLMLVGWSPVSSPSTSRGTSRPPLDLPHAA